jgi:hypothetical protein
MKTHEYIQRIITALECCGDQPEGADERCYECPYKKVDCACSRKLCSDAAELIKQFIEERAE